MFNRLFKILILFLCFNLTSNGQDLAPHEKYFTFAINGAFIGWSPVTLNTMGSSTNFQRSVNFGAGQVTDVNGRKHLALLSNTSLGASLGFIWRDKHKNNFTGVHLELQNNKACYGFRFPFTYSMHGDTTAKWVEADNYFKYSIALERYWYTDAENMLGGDSYIYWHQSFGQSFFHTNFGDKINADHQEDWTDNGTGMTTDIISVNQKSWILGTELGRRIYNEDKSRSLDIGLVYYSPFTPTFTEEYEFFKKGVSLGKNQITYKGASLLLNIRYTFNQKIKEKPIDSTKIKNEAKIVHHHRVNGRKFEVQKTISVNTDQLTVLVWDKNIVDGDVITLYLNNDPILENYTVSKKRKEIVLHLKPGTNYLVMHALNLGRIPPNTAAVQVNDGTSKKKNFTLVSDKKKSGAIEIIYQP